MTHDPQTNLAGADLEAWQDYRRWNQEQTYSPRTIQNRGEALAQLAAWLGENRPGMTVLGAVRHDVSDYLIWVGETRSGSTQLNRHRALNGFYNFCVAEDIIDASPMARIAAPEAAYKVPDALSDDQINAMLATCRVRKDAPFPARLAAARDEAMIRLFCEPGSPRASEMAGNMLGDFDFDADAVTLRGKRKAGVIRTRIIGMSSATARACSRYKRLRAQAPQARDTEAMWIGPKGPLTRFGIGQMTNRRGNRAGIPNVHPHRIRHAAFADFDEASGGNVNAAMALFGWDNPAMAHHYGKAVRAAAALRTAKEMQRGNRFGKVAG